MRHSKRRLFALGAALLVLLTWRLWWQVLAQLLCGVPLALAAFPLVLLLEKKLPPGLAAAVSLVALGACVLLVLVILLPALGRQGQQLLGLLPAISERMSSIVHKGESWLASNGLPVAHGLRQQLAVQGEVFLVKATPAVLTWAQQAAGNLSRWLLSPVFAFYYLRDRSIISGWSLSLLPPDKRNMCQHLLLEMRKETFGYLRGQLMVSLAVGGLTAVGLLLCGIDAWLLLGVLMGILELIPYMGPLIGGAIVLLFSLQAGTGRMLWALAVVLLVQQLEGGWLAPKMMSDATKLHPVAVLAIMVAGSAAGGAVGMLLAVPLALCLRAVFRVAVLSRRA